MQVNVIVRLFGVVTAKITAQLFNYLNHGFRYQDSCGYAVVAQSDRATPCRGEGCGFESHLWRKRGYQRAHHLRWEMAGME